MPAGAVRLVPFLTASVVVHAIVFVAAGPESLTISTAPADRGNEVSIRLEAAAPSGAAAHAGETSPEAPEAVMTKPPSHERSPEPPKPKQAQVAQIEPLPEPRPEPEPERTVRDESEPPAETESADNHGDRSKPEEEPVADETEPEPAERVAEVDDAATGDASTSSKAQRAEAREVIVAELAKHFSYPKLAQQRGWEGTVVLTVRILPDGRLDGIRVKRSSGRTLLDRSARRSLASVGRLPEFAERVGENGLALEIPVTYRLESA